MEAIGALRKGAKITAPKRKSKRLIGRDGSLSLELESEEATNANLVRALLGGLDFSLTAIF